MVRPPVLLTRRVPSRVLRRLEESCDVDVYDQGTMPSEVLRERVRSKAGLITVVTDRVDGSVLEASPDLKIIANIAVGYDNIDLAAARARSIVVTNTPDVLTEAVAEFTWGLIFTVTRRIAEGDRLVRRGAWTGWALDFMLGTELR